jgi:hypothetical protein
MTWHMQRSVTCDHPGCGAELRGDVCEPNVLPLQFHARTLGWKVERFSDDLCPQHNTTAPGSSVVSA